MTRITDDRNIEWNFFLTFYRCHQPLGVVVDRVLVEGHTLKPSRRPQYSFLPRGRLRAYAIEQAWEALLKRLGTVATAFGDVAVRGVYLCTQDYQSGEQFECRKHRDLLRAALGVLNTTLEGAYCMTDPGEGLVRSLVLNQGLSLRKTRTIFTVTAEDVEMQIALPCVKEMPGRGIFRQKRSREKS